MYILKTLNINLNKTPLNYAFLNNKRKTFVFMSSSMLYVIRVTDT